jgi:hypothetical protein
MARRGWIAFGIGIAVTVLFLVGYAVLGVARGSLDTGFVTPYGGF